MAMINPTGILNQDSSFGAGNLFTKDNTASSGMFSRTPQASNVVPISTPAPAPVPTNLNSELAGIQAIRAGLPTEGAGITQSIGGLGGAGIGAAIGGPAGAAIGGSIGGTLGSIVDSVLGSNAKKRANKKALAARRKELLRQKRLDNAKNRMSERLRIQGISSASEVGVLTEEALLRQQREGTMSKIMGEIQTKSQLDDTLRNKFLAGRRI